LLKIESICPKIILKKICWRQRFSNYKNALALLQEGVQIVMPSKIEEKGIIKAYEFTFELGWKAIKTI